MAFPEANYYTANISGFNLRALGSFYTHDSYNTAFTFMTGKAVIMLKNQDPNQGGIDYMTINMWSPFEANNFSDCKVINDCRPEHSQHPTHFFAQVRMVMKFRNQLDNGGAANYTTTHYAGTRASDKAEPNRHVWLRLKP